MAQQNIFQTGSAGQSAFKAAYDRLKSEAQAQKQAIGQDYSSIYNQLRGQQYAQGLGGAAQAGLSGGQAAGVQNRIGAAQMAQLGNVLQGQQRAIGEQVQGEAAITSNALLEGQQAQEYADRQQQTAFERMKTANEIIKGKGDYTGYTREQKIEALISLGYTQEQARAALGLNQAGQSPGEVAGRQIQQQLVDSGIKFGNVK
jgi:isopropylmalate/homocitrate/citramalate synthase